MRIWAKTEIEEIRDMILQRQMTYLQVAEHYNSTRSAIAGLCLRSGIRHAKKPERKRHIPKGWQTQHPMAVKEHKLQKTLFLATEPYMPPVPRPQEVWDPLPGSKPMHMLDLKRDQCRFPVTTKIGLSCGNHVQEGVYCATHRKIAYKEQTSARK